MEAAEYEVMYTNEDRHWWYRGLRDLVLPLVSAGGGCRVLDAGCGTGRNLEGLARAGVSVVGLERAAEAFPFLKARGLTGVARGSVCRLPFADATFDAVLSTDVICCVPAPADLDAAREFARVLKPGGRLVMNLPAYETLRSRHDAAVHTRQRYTRAGLVGLLTSAGLRVERAGYRNTLLFPLAAAARLVRRGGHAAGGSDVAPLPGPVNALLRLPLAAENAWLRAGGALPFGLSVYCVATREPGSPGRAGEGSP